MSPGAISIFFDLFALQHLHSELRVHAGVVTGCMDGDLFFNGFRSTQFDVDHPLLHLIDFNGNCSGEEPVL